MRRPLEDRRYNLVQFTVAALTVAALGAIVSTLPFGLLGTPDMHVTGNGSFGNSLKWFADRTTAVLPSAAAFSVPMWVYKVLILGWALWLSFALIGWLRWVWQVFSAEGLWRGKPKLFTGRSRQAKPGSNEHSETEAP